MISLYKYIVPCLGYTQRTQHFRIWIHLWHQVFKRILFSWVSRQAYPCNPQAPLLVTLCGWLFCHLAPWVWHAERLPQSHKESPPWRWKEMSRFWWIYMLCVHMCVYACLFVCVCVCMYICIDVTLSRAWMLDRFYSCSVFISLSSMTNTDILAPKIWALQMSPKKPNGDF
jgi:hypothetical protein